MPTARQRSHEIQFIGIKVFPNANGDDVHCGILQKLDWRSQGLHSSCSLAVSDAYQHLDWKNIVLQTILIPKSLHILRGEQSHI